MKFSSDYQPDHSKRSKQKRVMIIEALKRAGKTEEDFYDALVGSAIAGDSQLMKEVLVRMHQPYKPTAEPVEFAFDTTSPGSQVRSIMAAAARGDIPPDIALMFANAVKAGIEIEANTELKERIEKLEALIAGKEA